MSNDDKQSETLVGSSKPSAHPEDIGKSTAGKRKMRTDSVVKFHVNCQARSSSYDGSVITSAGYGYIKSFPDSKPGTPISQSLHS